MADFCSCAFYLYIHSCEVPYQIRNGVGFCSEKESFAPKNLFIKELRDSTSVRFHFEFCIWQ